MRDTLSHRGPDYAGEWFDAGGQVALGHRRLAIVDLSPGGRQPMSGGDGRYQIVFNGEIYNHRAVRAELEALGRQFATSSDTEVLLASYIQWGADCLARLNGMFAFAVLDLAKSEIFLARDRAGEKPLYIRQDENGFYFASELKALLHDPRLPRKISQAGLLEYLAYGYVPANACILEGFEKLPSGHWMVHDYAGGHTETGRYWDVPAYQQNDLGEDELAEALEALLRDSVSGQMIADVPVGVLLSGGVDSSLVAAAAAAVSSRPIKTFTIGFPGSAAHDESEYARQVAEYLGAEHTVLSADAQSVDLIPALVRQYDEPLADSSMIPTYMVSQQIRQHCTVALGGDGADEIFGGYLHYPWLRRLEAWRGMLAGNGALEGLVGKMLPIGTPGRGAALTAFSRYPSQITLTRMLDVTSRRNLVDRVSVPAVTGPEARRKAIEQQGENAIGRACRQDFQLYMPDDILVKVDRASMLSSLEVRAPFLDHRIAEFGFSMVAPSMKVDGARRKILLRNLAERMLPAKFDSTRKQGFSIPIAQWLQGEWAPLVQDLLESDSPFFRAGAAKLLLADLRANDRGANRVFQLAMLEAWRREYNVSV